MALMMANSYTGGMKKILGICFVTLGLMTACNDIDDDRPSADPAIDVDVNEEKIENAMEETGDALERGAEKTKDALENAGEEIERGLEDATDGIDDDKEIEVEVKKD